MQLILSIFWIFNAHLVPDPPAKKLLDKVQIVYEQAKSLDIQFSYEQSYSDLVGMVKKGQLTSKGEKFRLLLDDLEIYSDGQTQYTYLKKNKEMQISTPDAKENKYHPKNISSLHTSGTHSFRISKKVKEGGIQMIIVDFQSKDKSDPVASILLHIAEKTNQIHKVQWLERNGNKTMVRFSQSQFNKEIEDSIFSPNLQSLKGIHIEDLRE